LLFEAKITLVYYLKIKTILTGYFFSLCSGDGH